MAGGVRQVPFAKGPVPMPGGGGGGGEEPPLLGKKLYVTVASVNVETGKIEYLVDTHTLVGNVGFGMDGKALLVFSAEGVLTKIYADGVWRWVEVVEDKDNPRGRLAVVQGVGVGVR